MARICVTLMGLLVVQLICMVQHASCFEFEVGDDSGWKVPPANDTNIYNKWASENRFQVGDTLHFKYNKDSVMVVSESDYNQCNSSRPEFYYNSGDTIFKIDRSDLFYFISGVSGHCQRGQKMIIKVLGEPSSPTAPSSPSSPSNSSSAAAPIPFISAIAGSLPLSFIASHLLALFLSWS